VKAEAKCLASRIATISLIATTLVVAVKLVGAGLSHSVSVLAEAMQSLLDVLMAAITVWAVRYAAKEPDEGHPYGHGRAELLASAFQMVLALLTGGVIVWQAALRLSHPEPIHPDWGVAAMAFALVSNGAMMLLLRHGAKKTGSEMLRSEGAHLASDSLASVGVIAGLLLFRFTGQLWIDPAAAILFTIIGAFLAFRQLRGVLHPLMDGALDKKDLQRIKKVLDTHPEVRGSHELRTRTSGSVRYVDMHLLLDDDLTFTRAHDVADEIEAELKAVLGEAIVNVHYEPFQAEMARIHREAESNSPP
jgi:cation diffusion facilitator family transporter